MQHCKRNNIDNEAGGRDGQHGLRLDVAWTDEPFDRLVENPADDDEQAQSVDEGGEYLESLIAIGQPAIRWSFAHVECHRSKRERHGVGQHVTGIRQQREGPGQQATDHLNDHERTGKNQCDHHAPEITCAGRTRRCGRRAVRHRQSFPSVRLSR